MLLPSAGEKETLVGIVPYVCQNGGGVAWRGTWGVGLSQLLWCYFGPTDAHCSSQMNRLLTGDWGEELPMTHPIICNPKTRKSICEGGGGLEKEGSRRRG